MDIREMISFMIQPKHFLIFVMDLIRRKSIERLESGPDEFTAKFPQYSALYLQEKTLLAEFCAKVREVVEKIQTNQDEKSFVQQVQQMKMSKVIRNVIFIMKKYNIWTVESLISIDELDLSQLRAYVHSTN
jgi:hypothetical protein